MFFQNLENIDFRISEGISESYTLPNTGPKYGVFPITWTPDYKFKIVGKEFPNSDYQMRIWVKIIFNESLDMDQKDIMCSFLQHQNQNEIKNVILSCIIIPDLKQSRIAFHYYLLRDSKGWIRLKTYYYIGFKKSGTPQSNEHNSKESEKITFKDLLSLERGLLGESIGEIFTNRLFIEYKSSFFPELLNELIKIESGTPRYHTELSQMIRAESQLYFESWQPDLIFQVLSNVNANDLIFELKPKKIVWVEVKTGKNATFERSQKENMERSSLIQGLIILYCNILPESSDTNLTIRFSLVRFNSEWKNCTQYFYSDFPQLQ